MYERPINLGTYPKPIALAIVSLLRTNRKTTVKVFGRGPRGKNPCPNTLLNLGIKKAKHLAIFVYRKGV